MREPGSRLPAFVMKTGRPLHVFHPTDFSSGDEGAFRHALFFAVVSHGSLCLLHVKRPGEDVEWTDFPPVRESLERWGRLPEASTREDLEGLGLRIHKVVQSSLNVTRCVEEYVNEHQPELVVLSTHQRCGLDRMAHASTAEAIARVVGTRTLFVPRSTACFVHGADGKLDLWTVLVPVASSPHPRSAVRETLELVERLRPERVRVILLHVGHSSDVPAMEEPEDLPPGCTVEIRVRFGPVVETILATAAAVNADLMVMATHRHHGPMGALRGSTSERLLRLATCPVLAVPAP